MPEIVLSLLGKYWQSVALVAVSLLAWHFDARAVANADAVRVQAAQFKQAQASATAIAQAALQHVDAIYQAKAQEADNAHQAQLADAQSAADRYIASHSVCPTAAGRSASPAPGAAQSAAAGVPASLPAGAVVVSANDVHACTAAVGYAFAARNYVLSISAASQSTPSAEPTDGDH
ncbi:hypothetical protein [Novosphingobium sp. FSW06-99]|uniref:hypothetical protein n=1 Tax=Novosphingobium sp. FSW06-99 TaxID=1739113 RepID=UPI00076CB453|nr:hypothetical protein [Novosphingobium sp. FSW06-99]KUR80898.1 hypothetical protein AQZ49_02425 [Novosphingobium sp. FSW06-99]